MKKKRLITSALPYANNIPHLGTLIGCVLSADVFYRYCKIADYEALYICGTDEHGTTTETRAKQEGLSSRELCDKYYELQKGVYDWFEIDFSVFGRTSCSEQTEVVQDIFWKLYNNGYIIKDVLVQPHCKKCEMFLADRYVEGTCPHCDYDKAKGDQCEQCGKLLEPSELKEPRCTTCGEQPEFHETKHLFLDLEKLKPNLESWIEKASVEGHWSANSISVTKAWLEQGLKKRCITRDLEWGIPVPLEGYEDKVFYVWFDAPIGYISITASKYENWKEWWKRPEEVDLYQFMGKDNIPFHTVVFPASLLGTGEEWTMLKTISSTEYLNYEDLKFSKSRGTGVFGDQVRDTGIDVDLFRYYLLRNRPEKNDTQFYWMDFMEKTNGEIIANYANLVNRVFQFISKFYDGKVPAFNTGEGSLFARIGFKERVEAIVESYEKVELKRTLLEILELSSAGNKYFQDSQPWAVIKEDKERCAEIIGALAGFVKDVSILLFPYIPNGVKRVFKTFGLDESAIMIANISSYESIVGKEIGKPEVLYQKLEKKRIEELRDRFSGKKEEAVKFFNQLHLKVGKIIEVEKHPEADRLYIEKVDMGNGEIRQIVSGLVPYYKEEELLGKKVILAYNLKPAVLKGVESQGMLLAAETKKKKIVEVISPDCEIGEVVTIDGSAPNSEEITIDDFFQVTIEIDNFSAYYMGEPMMIGDKKVTVEKVEKGKVK